VVIWGVGVDLVAPETLQKKLYRRPELTHELFTPDEVAYCEAQWNPSEHFAGRFAAKEAVVKALRLDGWDPLDIEIQDGEPAPVVYLSGQAAQHADQLGVELTISITHLPAMAAAIAMAVPR
jgi:holo-[acyl-carrier protein] synthase